jgi:hypothetical protein
MRNTEMNVDWRTVQFFLDDDHGVAEVSIDSENHNRVMCSCPSFTKSNKCKHSKEVHIRVSENDGHYKIQIPDSIDDSIVIEALQDNTSFRYFLIQYGKIDVIE